MALIATPPAGATFPAEGNGKLAFSRDDNVWTMAYFGTNATTLGTGAQPAWSPMGAQLAFVVPATTALLVMGANGQDRTTIVTSGAAYPTWSPDALSIAYECGGDICSVVVATGISTNLTNSAEQEARPDWSPDGTKIAFQRTIAGPATHVFVMDANGSNPSDLTPVAGNYHEPSFKPDGSAIALVTDQFGNAEIGVIPATGIVSTAAVQRVTNHAALDDSPVWAPTGAMLAFRSMRDGNSEIYTINASLTGLHNRTNSANTEDAAPDWQIADNTVALQVAAGTSAPALVAQLGSGWNLGDFACSQVGGGNETLRLVQPTTGVQRDLAYSINSGGVSAAPFSYTLRLEETGDARGPDGGVMPFAAFVTVDGGPEVQLDDGANPFTTNGGDDLGTTVGTQFPNGQSCSSGAECVSGFCADGFCCDGACGALCNACNRSGLAGTCGPIAAGSDPANECSGASACNGSGSCTLSNGESCSSGTQCTSGSCADGVCCATACSDTCVRCNASPGTCTFIPAGTDPANECSGADVCNGGGECTLANGLSCSSGAQCTSGNCVDGVCCTNACTGTCRRCDVAGSFGSCSHVANGTDPDDECPAECVNGACAAMTSMPALGTWTMIALVATLMALLAALIVLRR